MPYSAALPFFLKRGTQIFTATGMTTTKETVHGLLRLEKHQLTIQWRVGRKTEHLDSGIRTDEEVEPVRQLVVPLDRVAGAMVRRRRWDGLFGPRLVLTAADLSAFEALAGADGLQLDHPAELVLRLRRSDRVAAEEFGAELALAIAQYEIPAGSDTPIAAADVHPALEVTGARELGTSTDTSDALPEGP